VTPPKEKKKKKKKKKKTRLSARCFRAQKKAARTDGPSRHPQSLHFPVHLPRLADQDQPAAGPIRFSVGNFWAWAVGGARGKRRRARMARWSPGGRDFSRRRSVPRTAATAKGCSRVSQPWLRTSANGSGQPIRRRLDQLRPSSGGGGPRLYHRPTGSSFTCWAGAILLRRLRRRFESGLGDRYLIKIGFRDFC